MKRYFPVMMFLFLVMGANARFNAVQAQNPPTAVENTGAPSGAKASLSVSSIAVSPEGRVAAVAYSGRVVKFWEILSGRELEPFSLHAKSFPVTAITFTPNPNFHLWSGKFVSFYFESTKCGERAGLGGARRGEVVVCSRDGKTVAIGGSDGATSVFNVETGEVVATLKVLPAAITAVIFTGDDELMTASGAEIRRWRISDGSLIETLVLGGTDSSVGGGKILAFSSDATQAACVETDGSISLWRLADRLRIRTLKGDGGAVTKLAFTPDGRTLIAAGADSRVRAFEVSGEVGARLFGEPTSLEKDRSVGISECDEYLRLYEKCMDNPEVPEEAKASMRNAIEQSRRVWRDALDKARNSPGSDAVLKATADACREAAKALKANQFCK